jgi:hypothetical protein
MKELRAGEALYVSFFNSKTWRNPDAQYQSSSGATNLYPEYNSKIPCLLLSSLQLFLQLGLGKT